MKTEYLILQDMQRIRQNKKIFSKDIYKIKTVQQYTKWM